MRVEDVVNYAFDCVSDLIISCQKHKWACQRFLNDYHAARKGESLYIYDWDKVKRVIEWATLFEHTKGVLTGKPIELHISQVFIVANIYGFYHKDSGYRRFVKMYYQVARKNAKSQLLAVLLTYELMVYLDGGMAEVYCAATKREQAKIVYNEVVKILGKSKDLKGKWKEAYSIVEHLKTGSTLRSLSKEDGQKGDGLNPQCTCIDEYHAHQTSEILDVIDSGDGARPDPLLAIITTAGFNLNYPCYQIEYKLAAQILNPDTEVTLDHVFADILELEVNETGEDITVDGNKIAPGDLIDNPFDEQNWAKANPIVCSYAEGLNNLRKKAEESSAAPEKKRNFYTKHLNVWVNQRDGGYMPMQKWAACKGEIPDLKRMPCYVGLDLSSKIDLTAAGLVFPFEIEDKTNYIVLSGAFMPETKFNEHLKTDKTAFYTLWREQGHLIVTKGPVVDYRAVTDWVVKKIADLGAYIEEWCVDPWGASQVSSDLIDDGHTVIDVIQGIKTLSEPTKAFREAVYNKEVIHDGNPLLAWAVGNAIQEMPDRNENILLSKKKSIERIDPIAAVINGFVRAYSGTVNGSIYNKNPLAIRSL